MKTRSPITLIVKPAYKGSKESLDFIGEMLYNILSSGHSQLSYLQKGFYSKVDERTLYVFMLDDIMFLATQKGMYKISIEAV